MRIHTKPDTELMAASYEALLQVVAATDIEGDKQGEPAVLARFNADVFNYDPFILKALGAEVDCPTQLSPVRNRPDGNGLSNVSVVELDQRRVVIQRTEIDLSGLPENVGGAYPEGLGRIVTYSAMAVDEGHYIDQHRKAKNTKI